MKEKQPITNEMRKELRADFPKSAYSSPSTKTFLTTLKAMYVTERLNDVFGMGRWTIIVEIIERTADYVLVQGEFISMDYDIVLPKQFGGHKTTGKNTEIADGYKSAITDCQSKIASYLEVGIEMFKGNIKVASAPKKNYDNNLPWLNPKTKEWDVVCDYINKGTITSIEQITKFKMSIENKEKLIMLMNKFN